MVDTRKIKALLVENDYTQYKIAKELGMSLNSFSRKVNNKTEFTLEEAFLLKEKLGIGNLEKIFLNKVSYICNDKSR